MKKQEVLKYVRVRDIKGTIWLDIDIEALLNENDIDAVDIGVTNGSLNFFNPKRL